MYVFGRVLFVRRIARFGRSHRPRWASAMRTPSPAVLGADVALLSRSLRAHGFDASLRLEPAVLRDLVFRGESISDSSPFPNFERTEFGAGDRLAEDSTLRELAETYFQAIASYQGNRIWWTRPGASADPLETGARFHYDLYDYRALIFLIYLTDVDPSTAPHVCVRGSHRSRRWRDQVHPRRHRSDEEIERVYGAERIVTICGPAGTVIAEDPFCFHKVELPARRERLALQLLFTGNDFPAPSFTRSAAARAGGSPRRGRD